jgi:hypothetical protein
MCKLPMELGAPVKWGVVPSSLTAHGACLGVLGGWVLIEMVADELH